MGDFSLEKGSGGEAVAALGESARSRNLAVPRATARRVGGPLLGDRIFQFGTMALALTVLVLLIGLGAELTVEAWPSLAKFGLRFFVGSQWDPVKEQFGALPFVYGTTVSSALALLLAVPLSLGVALCLSEMVPVWLATWLRFLVELLAAIPSVVYGLWGIFVLGPWLRDEVDPLLTGCCSALPLFQGPHIAVSMLTAGVLLAVMVIPYISAVATDVLGAVPATQREAALALGATRWEMVRLAVLPYGYVGIMGAVLLGLGRALGETIAVAMVIGNRPAISASLFMPASTLASTIANEFTEATSDLYLSALVELGLALLAVALVLNLLARTLVLRVTRQAQESGR